MIFNTLDNCLNISLFHVWKCEINKHIFASSLFNHLKQTT